MSKTKKDLEGDINVLEHNLRNCKIEQNIQFCRMKKLADYLESTGLNTREINNIMKLDSENR